MKAIVVTYKSENTISECITAALKAGVSEVTIWDNSPDELTREVNERRKCPQVRYLRSGQNVGFGAGVNKAIRVANFDPSESLLILNPDCIISQATLEKLMEILADEEVGLVAPLMAYPSGGYGFSGGPRPRLIKELLAMSSLDHLLPRRVHEFGVRWLTRDASGQSYEDGRVPGPPLPVQWVSGFCLLLHVSDLQRIGGFDEDFFLYFEDVDLSLRIREIGKSVVLVRNCTALHYESVSSTPKGKSQEYRKGMWVYFRKHGNRIERSISIWCQS